MHPLAMARALAEPVAPTRSPSRWSFRRFFFLSQSAKASSRAGKISQYLLDRDSLREQEEWLWQKMPHTATPNFNMVTRVISVLFLFCALLGTALGNEIETPPETYLIDCSEVGLLPQADSTTLWAETDPRDSNICVVTYHPSAGRSVTPLGRVNLHPDLTTPTWRTWP